MHNGDLDVDGHTNLDNVSVAGVNILALARVMETVISRDNGMTN